MRRMGDWFTGSSLWDDDELQTRSHFPPSINKHPTLLTWSDSSLDLPILNNTKDMAYGYKIFNLYDCTKYLCI